MKKPFSILWPRAGTRQSTYSDSRSLYEGLLKEEDNAIRTLYMRIRGGIHRLAMQHGLTQEDTEELAGDCVSVMMLKIRTGQYTFMGYDPATFVMEIAKNKVRGYRKKDTVAWEDHFEELEMPEPGTQEDVVLLEQLLSQLSENCRKLIQMKYLEGMKDKEVIEAQSTQYTTVDALKNKRAQCMKKLIELAQSLAKKTSRKRPPNI